MIDKELLEILACPLCKADVKQEKDSIVCAVCGRRYPIKGGIPVMLIDEAELPEDKPEGVEC
ncbi:MAG: Trm112 family protein [Candidatus Omnitrophota bacterium]